MYFVVWFSHIGLLWELKINLEFTGGLGIVEESQTNCTSTKSGGSKIIINDDYFLFIFLKQLVNIMSIPKNESTHSKQKSKKQHNF